MLSSALKIHSVILLDKQLNLSTELTQFERLIYIPQCKPGNLASFVVIWQQVKLNVSRGEFGGG